MLVWLRVVCCWRWCCQLAVLLLLLLLLLVTEHGAGYQVHLSL
jgi:hypothetical protein